ncbi:MAG TPA: ABC transporter substrate-binding protein [Stellaceae bacterium]|nr:ABC transporter substrate-binding protein [Stellaceae bacterium]
MTRPSRRDTASFAVIVALLLALSPAWAEDPYDLHAVLSLTGAGAFLGQEEQQALQLAEGVVNRGGGIHGRTVRFVFYDDQTNPQLAVQLAKQIIATRPALILGSSLVASCNAMAPLMQEGPVLYCFSPGIHPPAGSYVFTSGVSTRDQADALLRYFRLRGWKRIAIVTSTDATGQDADRGFDELLGRSENRDVVAVEREHFNSTDVSVAAQIERIKGARPDALVVWSTGTPVATVLRGLVQAGLELPVGTTGGNMTYAQMRNFANFLPQRLFLPSPAWAVRDEKRIPLPEAVMTKQRDFYGAYEAEGKEPDEGSTLGWDPVQILVDALRALPADADAAALRSYLLHLKGAAGVNGIYDFEASPQRGLSLQQTLVTRWNPARDHWDVVAEPTGIPLEQ